MVQDSGKMQNTLGQESNLAQSGCQNWEWPQQQQNKGCALLTRDDNKRRPEVVAVDLVVSLGRRTTGGPRNTLEVEGQSD